jgi:hypothetical protein
VYAELYRILHGMATPLQARQPLQAAEVLQPFQVEEALLMGALEHLHTQFCGMLRTICKERLRYVICTVGCDMSRVM